MFLCLWRDKYTIDATKLVSGLVVLRIKIATGMAARMSTFIIFLTRDPSLIWSGIGWVYMVCVRRNLSGLQTNTSPFVTKVLFLLWCDSCWRMETVWWQNVLKNMNFEIGSRSQQIATTILYILLQHLHYKDAEQLLVAYWLVVKLPDGKLTLKLR